MKVKKRTYKLFGKKTHPVLTENSPWIVLILCFMKLHFFDYCFE